MICNLYIAGEDGCLKIWSRIGMLRTKLTVNGEPILSADWNSDSSKIVYTQHDTLCIKSLKANIKTIRVRTKYRRNSMLENIVEDGFNRLQQYFFSNILPTCICLLRIDQRPQ